MPTPEPVDPVLLQILCCPETHQPLHHADSETLARINSRIEAGQITTRGGKRAEEVLDGGLIREDGQYLYAIRGRIPVLLIEEAIPLADPKKPGPTAS